jgi:peptide/nickel transport system permease protein
MTALAGDSVVVRRSVLPVGGQYAYFASLSTITLLIAAAVLAPLVAPYDPNALDLLNANAGPSGSHFLGTDASGRDILSRLIYGARLSMLGPFLVVVLSVLIGVPAGVLAGYRGGRADAVVSRITDMLLAFPPLLLAIVVVATFGTSFFTAAIAISVIYVPLVTRVVRSVVIAECRKDYVDAGRAQGFSDWRLASFHILPNAAGPIVAQSTLNFGYALLDLAGLSFLGLATQPPTSDWGQILSDGRGNILYSTSELASAAAVIAVAVLSFNILGDSLTKRIAR